MSSPAREDTEGALKAELQHICSTYGKYASQLNKACITMDILLADPDEELLLRAGMDNPVHARHCIAYVCYTGAQRGVLTTQEFPKVDDLEKVLEQWRPGCGIYADVFWEHEMTCIDQLAAAGPDLLMDVCNIPPIDAVDIAAKAGCRSPLQPPRVPARITVYDLLSSRLPLVMFEDSHEQDSITASPSMLKHLEPQDVLQWKHVDALDVSTELVDEAVRHHINNADKTTDGKLISLTAKRFSKLDKRVLHWVYNPRTHIPTTLNYEIEYTMLMRSELLDDLHVCANQLHTVRSCRGARTQWRLQEQDELMQTGISQQLISTAASVTQKTAQCEQSVAPVYSQGGQLQMKGSQSFGGQQSSSGPGEWHGKHALVLEWQCPNRTARPALDASSQALHSTSHSTLSAANLGGQTSLQPAAAAAAVPAKRPPNQKQFICVGEVQLANKLVLLSEMQYGSDVKPVDLCRAWSDSAHPCHEHVRAAVAQLYTYLQATQTCYGFLSCWYVTWLVCCPLGDREQLYISAPVLASTRHTSWAPAVTTRGALSWLQQYALSTRDQQPPPLRLPYARAAQCYTAAGSAGNELDCGGGRPALQQEDEHENEEVSHTAVKGKRRSSSSSRSSARQQKQHKKQQQQQQQQQLALSAAQIQLTSRICQGSLGLVMAGRYMGAEAVIKLLGPGCEGKKGCKYESSMYHRMQSAQGQLIPRFYGMGHLGCGVYGLAVSRIDGVSLSKLPEISHAVAVAAVDCLKSLVAAFPGFVHGDVRLPNVMLLSEGSCTAPRCVFIDFERSKLNGSKKEQREEQRQLKRLVGL